MKLSLVLKYLLIVYLFSFFALTSSVESVEWNNENFMSLDEIEKRMATGKVKGKCRTVFQGTEVEEFDIEILSIEWNSMPGWDVIWAKGKGGSFDETGIAGGMSGSPCYIDGRLFGAISLGFYWQKKGDIIGITPIEEMVQVSKWGMTPKVSYNGGISPSLGIESFCTYENNDENIFDQLIIPLKKTDMMENSKEQNKWLEIPVSVSGISSKAMELLNPLFSKYNMIPIQATGKTGNIDIDAPIEPGQVLGIEYARGDFTAFGYGTLTYKEDGQFLAYGHPAMGEGNANLPVSSGYIHFILPSLQRSSKIASPIKPVGTLVQDRIPAIAGTLGKSPSFIPIDIQVEAPDMPSSSKELHFEVLRHKELSASIAMSGVWSIVDGTVREYGDYTVDTNATISFSGKGLKTTEIKKNNVYSGSGPGFGALQVLSPLSSLIDNNFQPLKIDKITVDIKVKDKRNFAVIERAFIDKERYRPGEKVKLNVILRPYLEKPITKIGIIDIPEDMPDGEYRILISSANSHEAWQKNRAPLNFRPSNINQLIHLLQLGESNDSIIFEVFAPKPGMTIQGEEMPELPISMLSVLNSPIQTGERGITKGTTMLIEKIKTEYVVGGIKSLKIIIDRNSW